MESERLLLLASLLVATAGTFLFFLSPPPSPELFFVFATGIALFSLFLLAFSARSPPEEVEAEAPLEEKEVMREAEKDVEKPPSKETPIEEGLSKLMEALEVETGKGPKAEEKPKPDLLSRMREFSPKGWEKVGDGGVGEEALFDRKRATGGTGAFRILKKEDKRLALYVFVFPSSEIAETRLQEVMEKLGNRLYESFPREGRFHLMEEGIDGIIWRREEAVVLLLLGKGEKGEALSLMESLPEELRSLLTSS